MVSKPVKALIALTLCAATSGMPAAFAATSRTPQRTAAKRSVVKSRSRGTAKTVKARVAKKKPVAKARAAKKPAAKPPEIHVQGHENVFRALDRNSSGYVSRDEWPGSTMAFDVVDKNGDGRISLSELRSKED